MKAWRYMIDFVSCLNLDLFKTLDLGYTIKLWPVASGLFMSLNNILKERQVICYWEINPSSLKTKYTVKTWMILGAVTRDGSYQECRFMSCLIFMRLGPSGWIFWSLILTCGFSKTTMLIAWLCYLRPKFALTSQMLIFGDESLANKTLERTW